jgi:predicted DNA-binding protein
MIAFTLRLEEEMNEQLELLSFISRKPKTELIREAIQIHLDSQPPMSDPRK